MSVQIDSDSFAAQAYMYKDSGIPYTKLDCQAFVERVLSDCGIKHDWRGSNHMWRDALDWKGTIADCKKKYGAVPVGAWLFTVRHDGGEKKRGYDDDEGNAAHVGIFCGEDRGVMHSTTGGVQLGPWPDSKRWTHVGFCKYIQYFDKNADIILQLEKAIEILENLKGRIKE